MRWLLVVLVMCNGIYFLWQNYLVQNEQPVAESQAVATVTASEPLVLLTELSASNNSDGQVPGSAGLPEVKPVEVAADVAANPDICWQIGPFKEIVSGKQVVSRLAALDISLSLRSVEIPGEPDYWVHIPPQVSRKAAIKLLKELQAKKIDSFLITEGDLANGISLGFFTQQDRASKVYEKRTAQGYAAEIKLVPRTHTELWAVFDAGEYGKFSDVLWEKIKQGNSGLERRKNYCDKIASAHDFD